MRELVQHATESDYRVSYPRTLQILSFLDCREDQDRINALFGIVQSSNSWFMPAYCPTPDLYVNFALAYMRHFRSFDITHFAGTTEPTHHRLGVEDVFSITWPAGDLPSWVSDWRIRHRYLPIIPAEVEPQRQESKSFAFAPPFDPSRKSLTLCGKLLRTPIRPCGIPHLDGFEPSEDPQYQLAVDPWCNRIFVNFLNMLAPYWALHYISSKTFTHWVDSVLRSGEDASGHLLRFVATLIMDGRVQSYERPDIAIPQSRVWEYFLEYAKVQSVAFTDMVDNCETMEKAAAYGYLAEHVCRYRTLFLGDDNIVGLGSPGICPGDRICFFSSLKTPFVVHPNGEHFELRRECSPLGWPHEKAYD
ncbi:uncharacterized protein LTR77_002398 [Saxophila tyrrhenica]|uniref:Uncharacterized protein n=1 Tax=Saxophila tyrrhenica TaxID=1690608 RepID=A0AAV9PIS3_9PEZI|nr:hypothetical protein LTR77_002398 [Saxophila tyrrhenica]